MSFLILIGLFYSTRTINILQQMKNAVSHRVGRSLFSVSFLGLLSRRLFSVSFHTHTSLYITFDTESVDFVVAVCCSVLQCVVYITFDTKSVDFVVAVCCSVLYTCCCSVLQCVVYITFDTESVGLSSQSLFAVCFHIFRSLLPHLPQ